METPHQEGDVILHVSSSVIHILEDNQSMLIFTQYYKLRVWYWANITVLKAAFKIKKIYL